MTMCSEGVKELYECFFKYLYGGKKLDYAVHSVSFKRGALIIFYRNKIKNGVIRTHGAEKTVENNKKIINRVFIMNYSSNVLMNIGLLQTMQDPDLVRFLDEWADE